MSIYSVHGKPGDSPDKTVLVREGFSLAAFAFTVLWALAKGMWFVAAALFLIFAIIAAAANIFHLPDLVVMAMNLAVSAIFGCEAQELRRWSLRQAGNQDLALTSGSGFSEAELGYFSRLDPGGAQSGQVPVRVKPVSYAHDTLGLFGNV